MNDTPRVDESQRDSSGHDSGWTAFQEMANFARTLEREVKQLRANLDKWSNAELLGETERCELQKLRADNERMREALYSILNEHGASVYEAQDIGFSDGLFLKPSLFTMIKQALHPTQPNKPEDKEG